MSNNEFRSAKQWANDIGVLMGSGLIGVAMTTFWKKSEFPTGGVMVCLVGVVLISMSLWSQIKINVGGATLDLLRDQIRQTAEAAEVVANRLSKQQTQ